VAAQLDVTVALVRGLIRKGELQAVSLGHRTLRVTEHSLKAYLKKIGA
jgi:excisionase family DNA binding protein